MPIVTTVTQSKHSMATAISVILGQLEGFTNRTQYNVPIQGS